LAATKCPRIALGFLRTLTTISGRTCPSGRKDLSTSGKPPKGRRSTLNVMQRSRASTAPRCFPTAPQNLKIKNLLFLARKLCDCPAATHFERYFHCWQELCEEVVRECTWAEDDHFLPYMPKCKQYPSKLDPYKRCTEVRVTGAYAERVAGVRRSGTLAIGAIMSAALAMVKLAS